MVLTKYSNYFKKYTFQKISRNCKKKLIHKHKGTRKRLHFSRWYVTVCIWAIVHMFKYNRKTLQLFLADINTGKIFLTIRKHQHDDGCGCWHDHEHHHEHGDTCGCGHDHHHEGVNAHGKRVYILENLGCSNCAAKIERKINELDEVSEAVLTSG